MHRKRFIIWLNAWIYRLLFLRFVVKFMPKANFHWKFVSRVLRQILRINEQECNKVLRKLTVRKNIAKRTQFFWCQTDRKQGIFFYLRIILTCERKEVSIFWKICKLEIFDNSIQGFVLLKMKRKMFDNIMD